VKKGADRPKGAGGLPGWLVTVGLAAALVGLGLWWRQGSSGVGAEVQTAREDGIARSGADEVGEPERHLAERRDVRVVRVLPHDPEAFTQGLLWWHGSLWESTGQYGHSDVRQVDPETGEVLRRTTLTPDLFGEGLARVGERLFQLTWREDTALRWTLPDLEPDGRFSYTGEGWGLCFDGEQLVWSDGSDRLRFVKPEDFAVVRVQPVTLDGRPLRQLNELECVGDRVWANVWTTDFLVEIDPTTGRVETLIDAAGLLTREERRRTDVLNGIAYRPESGTYFITGKLWPKMFEVRLDAEEIPGSSSAAIE
jgi:glutamine cyclotransferase